LIWISFSKLGYLAKLVKFKAASGLAEKPLNSDQKEVKFNEILEAELQ
jgi:hypothetical protein